MGITHLLNRSITIERQSLDGSGKPIYDGYGNPVYDSPESIKARIFKKTHITRNIEGDEVVATSKIFIEVTAKEKDRVTLPTGEKPLILAVDDQDDYIDYHHTLIHT